MAAEDREKITISPKILTFKWENSTDIPDADVTIWNQHDHHYVFFKVKTTAPKDYVTRPPFGFIEPGQRISISFRLVPKNAKKCFHKNMKSKDKFLIQTKLEKNCANMSDERRKEIFRGPMDKSHKFSAQFFYDESIQSKQQKCPNSHNLTEGQINRTGFGCDNCGSIIAVATVHHYCRPCDFDLCDSCYMELNQITTIESSFNRDGFPMARGKQESTRLYCGRFLGRTTIPGTDGRCGIHNGPQCSDCEYSQQMGITASMNLAGNEIFWNFENNKYSFCCGKDIGSSGMCGSTDSVTCTNCKSLTSLLQNTCPNGHSLRMGRIVKFNSTCNKCGNNLPINLPYVKCYQCKSCQFDLCENCFMSDGSVEGSKEDSTQLTQRRRPSLLLAAEPVSNLSSSSQMSPQQECPICSNEYSDSEKTYLPLMLTTCGHSFCHSCCNRLYSDLKIKCPFCSAITQCQAVEDLPRNWTLISILRQTEKPEASHQLTSKFNDVLLSDVEVFLQLFQWKFGLDLTSEQIEVVSQNLPRAIETGSISQLQINHSRWLMRAVSRSDSMNTSMLSPEETSGPTSIKMCENPEEDTPCVRIAVHWCNECKLSFCAECVAETHKPKIMKKHNITSILSQKRYCCLHKDQVLDLICEVDFELVCTKCVTVGDHFGHKCREVSDVATEMRVLLKPTLDMSTQLKNAIILRESTLNIGDMENLLISKKSEISVEFEETIKFLNQSKEKILLSMDNNFELFKNERLNDLKECQEMRQQLEEDIQFVHTTIEPESNDLNVLLNAKKITDNLKKSSVFDAKPIKIFQENEILHNIHDYFQPFDHMVDDFIKKLEDEIPFSLLPVGPGLVATFKDSIILNVNITNPLCENYTSFTFQGQMRDFSEIDSSADTNQFTPFVQLFSGEQSTIQLSGSAWRCSCEYNFRVRGEGADGSFTTWSEIATIQTPHVLMINNGEEFSPPNSTLLKPDFDAHLFQMFGNIASIDLCLVYQGSRDGFSGESFHQHCDHCSKSLVVIKSTNGYLSGGFADETWDSSISVNRRNAEGFIFSLFPTPFQLIQNEPTCDGLITSPTSSPCFGKGDIELSTDMKTSGNVSNSPLKTYNKLSTAHCFEKNQNPENVYLFGGKYFEVEEIEVYNVKKPENGTCVIS